MNNMSEDVLYYTEKTIDVPLGSVLKHCRTRSVTLARALSQYIMKLVTNKSYEEIATLFKRDISAVRYNCKKIVKLLEAQDEYTLLCYNTIISKLEVL